MSRLSISNIAWASDQDEAVYNLMKEFGFSGLEIAPTRIIPDSPYDNTEKVKAWADSVGSKYGFSISSMQSIWYGRSEMLFGRDEEREFLTGYTKKAIEFAEAIGCKNLVFGCPRNRNLPEGADKNIALSFFREIGDYAYNHGTVIGIEANPAIYNTNFINDTKTALDLIEQVDSKGFKLNLDIGTMITNDEDVSVLSGREGLINHIHISEPKLLPIEERKLHEDIADLVNTSHYDGYISIETGKQDDVRAIADMMKYVRRIFE